MTDAMSGKNADVGALREMSEHLKSEAEASASGLGGDAGASGASKGDGCEGVALQALPMWPAAQGQPADSDDEDSCCEGEVMDAFAREFLH